MSKDILLLNVSYHCIIFSAYVRIVCSFQKTIAAMISVVIFQSIKIFLLHLNLLHGNIILTSSKSRKNEHVIKILVSVLFISVILGSQKTESLFEYYWEHCGEIGWRKFILNRVEKIKKRRVTVEVKSNRNFTFRYSFIVICKVMFMNTLNVSRTQICKWINMGEHGIAVLRKRKARNNNIIIGN